MYGQFHHEKKGVLKEGMKEQPQYTLGKKFQKRFYQKERPENREKFWVDSAHWGPS
jgi:hypothetical protein